MAARFRAMGEAALTRRAREAGLDRMMPGASETTSSGSPRPRVRAERRRSPSPRLPWSRPSGATRTLAPVAAQAAGGSRLGQGGCARRCRPRTGRRWYSDRSRPANSPPTAAAGDRRPSSVNSRLSSLNASSVAHREAARQKLHRQVLRPGCGPSGSPGSRSGTPPRGRRSAAPHSTRPSAVFRRPMRWRQLARRVGPGARIFGGCGRRSAQAVRARGHEFE